MGASASSHDLLAFAEEIPYDASKDQILKLARRKFPNAEVARMVPLYEAFREEKVVEAVARNLNRKSVQDISVNGLRVLLRADFDVPRDKDGRITDTTRIDAIAPTIQYLLDRGARSIVVAAHLGQPNGHFSRQCSLRGEVHHALEKSIGRHVEMLDDCIGPDVVVECLDPVDGSVILLENLRFHIEEQGEGVNMETLVPVTADPQLIAHFCEDLSGLGDVFVNDAFSIAHLNHSSIVGIQTSRRVSGLLMKRELEIFSQVMNTPARPLLAILGGAKISEKVELIESFLDKVDELIVGGAVAFTFLEATAHMRVGDSMYEADAADHVAAIMKKAAAKGVKIHFPTDFVTGDRVSADAALGHAYVKPGIKNGLKGLDIGHESAKKFVQVIARAKTIVWNGPMGVCELKPFSSGSKVCNGNSTPAAFDGGSRQPRN
eukprot:INCI6217.1.p1 GENE.INCI6217.1~~INCI6217.1.p1  ORF type:complete len:434 (+),score=75.48 INCI6217.1:190-1491(+)